ncbi:ABC transporter ATP-binding protein [Corynebacterium phocae]|uniref:ABC transporter ATP-binding protein n=1 Tax=Corynebacterium phocae TaxID=161895 RepID=UPI001472404B|nr:ABC transporter ATP-binding protein [Corynebacterium phocae]
MSDKTTVVARNLAKSYFLPNSGSSLAFSKSRAREIKALQSTSFVARARESIGILGKNGSGKSTLIRLIAGAESPSEGEVLVSAKPTLLGVSAAMQKSMSGRENVRIGLLAMGVSPDIVKELTPKIIEWAELSDSIDRPMTTYSSGMAARLKFSISTAVQTEILLVDEALSTGDATFKAKATKRMNEFLDTAGTVFLVSHGAETVQQHCSRAIWLHEGRVIADGPANQVTKSYRVWGNRVATGRSAEAAKIIKGMTEKYTRPTIYFDDEFVCALDRSTAR